MRVFFGLPVPVDAQGATARWRASVGTEVPDARLTPEANLHVTINFIGEVDDAEVVRLGAICLEVAREAAPVPAAFAGLGLLPSPARARVICLGMTEGEGDLRALAYALGRRLDGTTYRRFLAHITVARVRGVERSAAKRLGRVHLPPARGTFRLLVLYQSVLRPVGASYQPLQVANLGSFG